MQNGGFRRQCSQQGKQLYDLYLSNPEPLLLDPWSDKEKLELQELLQPDMPLEQTHLGVAAKQMAVATVNNLAHLDGETHNKLLQSLTTFECDQCSAS